MIRVVLLEGRNREIRRLFKALGHPVVELHRSKVAFLTDKELGSGSYRHLSSYEIRRIKRETGGGQRSRSSTSRTRRRRSLQKGQP